MRVSQTLRTGATTFWLPTVVPNNLTCLKYMAFDHTKTSFEPLSRSTQATQPPLQSRYSRQRRHGAITAINLCQKKVRSKLWQGTFSDTIAPRIQRRQTSKLERLEQSTTTTNLHTLRKEVEAIKSPQSRASAATLTSGDSAPTLTPPKDRGDSLKTLKKPRRYLITSPKTRRAY